MPQRFIRRSHKIIIHCILFTFDESVGIGTDRLDILADSVRVSGTPKSYLKEAFLRKKGKLKMAKSKMNKLVQELALIGWTYWLTASIG